MIDDPLKALSIARERAPMMVATLALAGLRIKADRAGEVLRALTELSDAETWPAKCWVLIDGWQEREERQSESGVSAVAFAVALILRDIPEWERIDWPAVLRPLEEKPTARPG